MAETKALRSEIRDLKKIVLELKQGIEGLKGNAAEKNVKEMNTGTEKFMSEIIEMKETYNSNLESVKSCLAEQTILIKNMMDNIYPVPKFASIFPIETQEDLQALVAHISIDNEEHMVETVHHFIQKGGIKPNIHSILGEQIILEHNIDGKQGKLRLTQYEKLMRVFFEAAKKMGKSEKECTEELRAAFKSIKNRHHKASCLKRKRETN